MNTQNKKYKDAVYFFSEHHSHTHFPVHDKEKIIIVIEAILNKSEKAIVFINDQKLYEIIKPTLQSYKDQVNINILHKKNLSQQKYIIENNLSDIDFLVGDENKFFFSDKKSKNKNVGCFNNPTFCQNLIKGFETLIDI